MTRFHINKHGQPAVCRAKPGNCPLGGDESHFNSKEEAQAASDKKNEQKYNILPSVNEGKNEKLFKKAKSKKDWDEIKKRKNALRGKGSNITYIDRCKEVKRIHNFVPLKKKGTHHYREERNYRVEGLKREFGEGNVIAYYEVNHRLEKSKRYKTQIMELRDNGIMTVLDYRTKKAVTTFIPYKGRLEGMMLKSGEIPSDEFLGRVIKNKEHAKKLNLDD